MDDHARSGFDKYFNSLSPCRYDFYKYWIVQQWRQRRCKSTSDVDGSSLTYEDYDQIMRGFEQDFDRRLSNPSQHKKPCEKGIHFLGLQRWNSISPAEGSSLGGGYLLYRTTNIGVVDLGIAIDPGFDFIRNLFHCGFSLSDIDVILLSHGHLDHIRDFESIVTLLQELDGRKGQYKRINVILTLGTFQRLQHVFENQTQRRYVEPLVIDIEKDIDRKYFEDLGKYSSRTKFLLSPIPSPVKDKWVKPTWRAELPKIEQIPHPEDLVIWPTRAYHDDCTHRSDSFGFKIQLPIGDGASSLVFGYTGDTKWVGEPLYSTEQANYCPQGVAKQYSDCDVLLIHLGSLIDHRNGQRFSPPNRYSSKEELRKKECEDLVRSKNHLYLPGLIGFLNQIWGSDQSKPALILLSEFGEELRGQIRDDFVQRLRMVYNLKRNAREILPVDIGLDVACKPTEKDAFEFKFWCVQCSQYHRVDRVTYQHFGQDEALFYLCQTCKKTASQDVLQERLRHIYELGQELAPYGSENTEN